MCAIFRSCPAVTLQSKLGEENFHRTSDEDDRQQILVRENPNIEKDDRLHTIDKL
jgi:hypothetical protein